MRRTDKSPPMPAVARDSCFCDHYQGISNALEIRRICIEESKRVDVVYAAIEND